MRHPIESWTRKQVESWRRKSACIGIAVNHIFTESERWQAIEKLQKLYPQSRVYPAFADRILYLSELY